MWNCLLNAPSLTRWDLSALMITVFEQAWNSLISRLSRSPTLFQKVT